MHIAFYAMLRWDESSHLRTGDVKISQWGMHLIIRSSKTDQAGEGATVAVKRLDKAEDCPVTLTEQYWQMLGFHAEDQTSWLQPRIQCTKNTEKGIGEYRLSYSNASADLKKMLQEIGEDPSQYGEHSGRRGGATAAAEAGTSWLDLKRHGRWKSDKAPQAYIDANERGKRRTAELLAKNAPGQDASGQSGTSKVEIDSTAVLAAHDVKTEKVEKKPRQQGWSPWQ